MSDPAEIPEPGSFDVRLEPAREAVRLHPRGELDRTTFPKLRQPIDELLAVGFTELVIDLRGLSCIDAAGLALIGGLVTQARREGWKLTVVPGGGHVHRDELTRSAQPVAGDRL